ncbi:2-oxo-3-deoxygalactonate 6-phosphate aldolase [Actibacterium mucosum KCTC 23349]|uniref:2-oxo-3-deoxygalactonate 6-phosphate aldolase n=1 Tax=Actibacterium mucosum KCTC 23349 TaxID=1454373 RepID=A0A037ZK57_9RHOB|nr:enolase C-terminal domain-like protein [Actibacterium mucosum]KAJ56483.1 2-oxo-3-deoxygalactonate 6-phosphate aldolase [Actibacterium mucosum KCTC 23349]
MKITAITSHVCNAGMRNWIFVKVETDQPGLVGWGEATLEWKTRAVTGAIDDLAPLMIGTDPRDIEQAMQRMLRHGFWRLGVVGMSAVSGIEIALWDILGKSLNVPVWRLLGGKTRDHLRSYTHLGLGNQQAVYNSDTAASLKDRALEVVEMGYDAIKVVCVPYTHYLSTPAAVQDLDNLMSTLRQAVGGKVDIMVDFHGRPASAAAARPYLDVLSHYNVMFAEEPVPPEDMAGHAALTAEGRVPIASGERLIGRREFDPAIAARAFDIAQPDIVHAGGLWETRKIAARAETAGIGLAPHNPLGPIAGVAALHFGIATPNVVIQEEMTGAVPWYDQVVGWPITRKPGKWDLPTAAGLGVTVDEAAIAAHPFQQEPFVAADAVGRDGTILDW